MVKDLWWREERDKSSRKVMKATARALFNSALRVAPLPGTGKSSAMKKLIKRLNKDRPKGTPKIKYKKLHKIRKLKARDVAGYLVPAPKGYTAPPWALTPAQEVEQAAAQRKNQEFLAVLFDEID